jgi:uncharacterized protein with NRDE domain
MCTVSWSRHSNGEFALCFNRDEQHTRAAGLPPRIWPGGFIAPVDATAGGTWLAVRRDGGVLALLNLYREGVARISGGGSRGAIIPALAVADEMPTLASLKKLVTGPMNAFRLLSLTPDARGTLFIWNGSAFSTQRIDKSVGMLTSSSWNTAAVISQRTATFREFLKESPEPQIAELYRFHQWHHICGEGWSICMTRDDARSVSLNSVLVANGRAEMTQRLRARGESGFDEKCDSMEMALTAR